VHVAMHSDFTRKKTRTIPIVAILQVFTRATTADGRANSVWKPDL